MELRLEFTEQSLDYLANLCHNCGSCYHNCQYAPPHEFNMNVPAVFAELRQENYEVYAWPSFMGKLFKNNGLWVALMSVLALLGFVYGTSISSGNNFLISHDNAFYGVLSHQTLVNIFGTVALFILLALSLSVRNFWSAMNLPSPSSLNWNEVLQGVKDALSLKYLDGGNGQGCSYPTEKPSMARRWFHQLTFWGFMLCFAATSIGTFKHYLLDLPAPYGYISLPKLFGVLGGIGLIIGPIGLMLLKRIADPAVKGESNQGMDLMFLWLLLLTSITGLVLMLFKTTAWVGPLLSVHLGIVLALFISMPYGKFIHGFYRLIALVAFAIEFKHQKPVVGIKKG